MLVLFVHGALVRDANWWWHRMPGRQDAAALTTPVTVPAWHTVPSTCLVCTQDQAIPAEAQRAAAVRAGRTVEIPTGHHPFLSRPDLFADTLAGTIRTSATLPP